MAATVASAETREYQRSQVALRALVYQDVGTLWRLLEFDKLDQSFPYFAAATVKLIEARRVKSADLARAYLQVRRRGVSGTAPQVATPKLNRDAAVASLRITTVIGLKSATRLGTDRDLALRNALVRTMGVVDKYVGDAGRELIRQSVDADPMAKGWVRRTLGTCDYCRAQAAGAHVKDGTADFPRHDHCGCQPEPQYEGKTDLQPEEQYVTRILADLRRNPAEVRAQLEAALAGDLAPLSRANVNEALARFDAELRARLATETLLTESQYEVLRPLSTWTQERRDEILSELRSTQQGKILADTLERFQDGGSIARLRSKIDAYLSGEEIDATSRARVEVLLDALRNAPDWAPEELFRGMTVKGKVDNVLKKYVAGDELDLSLTSFSSNRKVAARFQQLTAKGGTETRIMVRLIGEGKRVLPIQNLPADRRLFNEKEWVGAGKYEIVSAKKVSGQIQLTIRQVAAK